MTNLYQNIADQTNGVFLKEGYATCVAALQHNFKTGFLLETMVHHALHSPNNGAALNSIIFVSTDHPEGTVEKLAKLITKYTGATCHNALAFVKGWFLGRGFNFHLKHHDIKTPQDIQTVEESIEHLIGTDKLSLLVLDTPNELVKMEAPEDHRMLARRLRKLATAHNGHYLFTNMLSGDALKLYREATDDTEFLEQVTGGNYHAHSQLISQEVDLELFLVKDDKALLVGRGKCRTPHVVQSSKVTKVAFHDTLPGIAA